jgi:hypothetical protein
MTPKIDHNDTATCSRGTLLNYHRGLNLRFLEDERVFLWYYKTYWEGTLSRQYPLMWFDKRTNLFYMPDRHMKRTDLGSIPVFVQAHIPPTQAPYAYYSHDAGYENGGMWVAEHLEGPWRFQKMSRAELDELCLSAMLEAGGFSMCRRGTIWNTVRVAGGFCWKPVYPVEESTVPPVSVP